MNYLDLIEEYSRDFEGISILIEDNETFKVTVKLGEVEELKSYKSRDHFVRLLKGDKLLSFRVSGDNLQSIREMIEKHMDLFAYLKGDKCNIVPESEKYKGDLFLKDDNFNSIDKNKHLNTALEIEANALNYSNYVKNVRYTSFSSTKSKIYLINSYGEVLTQEKTVYNGSTYVVADNGKDSQSGYDFQSSISYDKFDYNMVGKRAAKAAVRLLNAKKLPSAKYYIVFENSVMAEFLELIAELVNAENVIKNKSLFKDKLDSKVASSSFTLLDNSKIESSVGSYYFDDEGISGGETVLIDNGILGGYLHNSYTSLKMNMKNTGNASITQSGKMGISISNLILKEGKESLESDMGNYSELLFVTDVMGMHMADTISGDFSVGINGLYYKNGELVTPFKEMVLTGNLKELLLSVVKVYNDVRDFGDIITPSVLFDKFSVSGN